MGSIGHRKITPDELVAAIARELEDWSDGTTESIDEASNIVTKELLENIREDSPVGSTGRYKKGWKRKKLKYSYVVHNKNKPGLTHLLEHGHAKSGGGRVEGKPHIRPNEVRANEKFEDLCVAIISEGLRLK